MCGTLLLSGCQISPLATRTAAFSTAATATIAQTENAYQRVNQAYLDAQVTHLVANYDTQGFQSSLFQPILTPKDLAVRTQVLNGLQQYATLLAEVSGNQPITELETQTKAVGSALTKMQKDDFQSFKVNATDKNIAETAVVAIGSVLIEHQRAHALPRILNQMNPPIQEISRILERDIGTVGSPGLASLLHRKFDDQIADEQQYIRINEKALTPDQKRTEIETLPKLLLAQQQADQALAATSKALAAFAACHAALTETKAQKNSPAFRLELAKMEQNVQALSSFYSSLGAK